MSVEYELPSGEKERLEYWQTKLSRAEADYEEYLAGIDEREQYYLGFGKEIKINENSSEGESAHIRNICAELIEAQVDSAIPMPKVRPMREQDEALAKCIEDMIRQELDRLPMEEINDMLARTVPIQGGAALLVEWDNTEKTPFSVGEITVTALSPKQIVPQDGVYSSIEDMDYIFVKLPQTKGYIKRRYDKEVWDESESDPDTRGQDDTDSSEEMVTQIVVYYRNSVGGIGRFSYVNDVVLEDLEDYQARRTPVCTECGRRLAAGETVCPTCGSSKSEYQDEEEENIEEPVPLMNGGTIGGVMREPYLTGKRDALGVPEVGVREKPTVAKYYKPDSYPIIAQKNVSVFGQFWGDSDIDKIKTHQQALNRLAQKMLEKTCMAGSYMILPSDCDIEVGDKECKIVRPESAASASMISVKTVEGDISQDMALYRQIYEESRQIIGITDSFQGRTDRTATSGRAKQFAAAQSAGRLESKRVMKQAAWQRLFELIFKFKLAYTDEIRPIAARGVDGASSYTQFNRYDFLEQDEWGDFVYNDRFIFSCDTAAPLASNREAMWQETRMNLQSGAFGDPTQIDTLILFWRKMEMLHYPGAAETKTYLEQKQQEQLQAAEMQAQQQAMQQAQAQQQRQQQLYAEQMGRAQQSAMYQAQRQNIG